jgi:hypothetical protein
MSLNIIHPKFISAILNAEKIDHRFVYILEAETRNETIENDHLPKSKFIMRTSKGILDPRKVPINQLLPLPKYGIPATDGKFRIMNFIYSVKTDTDNDGWQYKKHWNNDNNNDDQHWNGENNSNFNVRRRLWISVEVNSGDIKHSKILINEAILNNVTGVIMASDINRLVIGTMKTNWVNYYMELDDNYLIFKKDKKSNVIIDKFNIIESKIEILHKPQTRPEKSTAFIIKFKFSRNSSKEEINLQLDTNNDMELRRKWLVTLLYQVAILTPNLDFTPFPYGPVYINNVKNSYYLSESEGDENIHDCSILSSNKRDIQKQHDVHEGREISGRISTFQSGYYIYIIIYTL